MRNFIPFNQNYVGPNTEANSQHPEDLITSLAISSVAKGIKPLISIKTAPNNGGTLYRPQINIGKAAHGDFDDPFEKEPERGTDAHPYMNPEAMKHWGCNSRNWYGYNSGSWFPIKGHFYKKYHPEIHKDYESINAGAPKVEDFVAEHGETQKAWKEWSKASLDHQTKRDRVSKDRLENEKLVDPRQHFRNALFNVTSLYKDALASDGRNFPGKDSHTMLRRYFEKNPHLRTPNVEWATGHLDHLKNSIEEHAAGKWNSSYNEMGEHLKSLGFSDHFVEKETYPRKPEEQNRQFQRTTPDLPGHTQNHLWMPDRHEPYAIHISYHHNPLTTDPSRKHMFAMEQYTGGKRVQSLHPMNELHTVVPAAMETVASKVGKSHQVHKGLLHHLLQIDRPEDHMGEDWGFSGRRAPMNFGNSPEDFANTFLGK